MRRVLIVTVGSLGDLNPMLAIGAQLRASGASVTFATSASYEDLCSKNGFKFAPYGSAESYVRALHYTREMLEPESFAKFVDRVNIEGLDQRYDELMAAAGDAEILVAPAHVVPAPLVAEKLAIPYVACAFCLLHLKLPAATGTEEYRRYSASAARWNSILRKLRQSRGLERRVLPYTSLLGEATTILGAMPSFLLTASDRRLPNLEVVGYPEHQQMDRMTQDARLKNFCDERTVAYSFGSYADACDPDHFFRVSVAACRALGVKCVYLTLHPTPAMLESQAADVMVRADVAPDAVFPLVGTVVHHGGTGTLVSACRHAKAMAIVPFFLDQPMHSARMNALLGVPHTPARHYDRDAATSLLQAACDRREYTQAALRELIGDCENGAVRAARNILATTTRGGLARFQDEIG